MASWVTYSLYDVEKLKAAISNAYLRAGGGLGPGETAWRDIDTIVQNMSAQETYEMASKLDDMGVLWDAYNDVYPAPVGSASHVCGNAIQIESSVIGTAAEETAIEAAQVINSNTTAAAARTATLQIPGDYVATQSGVSVSAGAKTAGGATKATALGNAVQAVVAAGIGLKCGVWLDGGIYNLNKDYFDRNNMWYYNPETWADCTIGEGLLKLSDYPYSPVLMDDEGQMYADQELFAAVAQYMAATGAFSPNTPYCTRDENQSFDLFNYPQYIGRNWMYYINNAQFDFGIWGPVIFTASNNEEDVYIFIASNDPDGIGNYAYFAISKDSFDITGNWSALEYGTDNAGDTFYYRYGYASAGGNPQLTGNWNYTPSTEMGYNQDFWFNDIPIILFNGKNGYLGVEGINPYAQTPQGITPEMTIPQVINLLEQQYPDLFDDKLKLGNLQPDGTVTDKYYVPIGWPSGGTDQQPTSKPEDNSKVDPNNKEQTKRATETNKPTDQTGNEDDKGKGSTPPYVAPTGSADALYTIYNPTDLQVKNLGAWLWSSNFIDQLLKMFSSPMEAIISLHKIYGTPTTGGTQNIKVGYLDSGVPSKVVTDQYIHIDCGTVGVMEAFGNVFDYGPYTEISLYLPFIGIVTLDIADVMRGRVNVKYHIDVITGAVLAEVRILRDGTSGGVIYQYTGSCAEHYPLSAGSYMGIVTGAAGIAAGVAGTVLSGGALAPMLLGGAASIGSMHTNIQKSGGFSANAGAMGIKKPYFIISRPQPAMAQQYQHFTGMGANTYCTLASCDGYVRVKHIHLEGIQGATAADLAAIKISLLEGVLI